MKLIAFTGIRHVQFPEDRDPDFPCSDAHLSCMLQPGSLVEYSLSSILAQVLLISYYSLLPIRSHSEA